MIKKIISGGQTGADQAALDAALKLDIPHGGWIPKGKITENGPLPDKYQLDEMPTTSYPKRTVQNIIGSDGTLIISRGGLTGGSAYTRKMAVKHHRPWLHINLNRTPSFGASVKINIWVLENDIEVLNVAGPRASKDPEIYQLVKDIIESAYHLGLTGNNISDTLQGLPQTVEEAVDQIIAEMHIRDRTLIAALSEDDLFILEQILGIYIKQKLDEWAVNEQLLGSCRELADDDNLNESDAAGIIIKELWKKLRETHKLRVVK
jgi:hypothetical protein